MVNISSYWGFIILAFFFGMTIGFFIGKDAGEEQGYERGVRNFTDPQTREDFYLFLKLNTLMPNELSEFLKTLKNAGKLK